MYSTARHRQRNSQRVYREYVCDSLQAAPQGKYLQQRIADLMAPGRARDFDAEAVVEHVISTLEG